MPNVGNSSALNCPDLVKCSLRHSANSMRIGIVLKLSKAFEEVGRRGPLEKDTMSGDPTKSLLVQEYITYKQDGARSFWTHKEKHLLCPDQRWIS